MTFVANVNPKRRRKSGFPVVFDKLLQDFVNTGFSELTKNNFATTRPAANVKETESGFQIDLAIPGLKKEDIDINIDELLLTISGKTTSEEEVKEEKYTRQEFNYTAFSRSFTLNENIDIDNISAAHNNGVLSVILPKKEEVKQEKKVIEIA